MGRLANGKKQALNLRRQFDRRWKEFVTPLASGPFRRAARALSREKRWMMVTINAKQKGGRKDCGRCAQPPNAGPRARKFSLRPAL